MKNQFFTYKNYNGSINFELESHTLFGKILFIDDLITYESDNLQQLEVEFKNAVEDYIETCTQLNRKPQKAYSGTFNVRFGPELHKEVATHAYREGMTLNEFIKNAAQEKINTKLKIHKHLHEHVIKHLAEEHSTHLNVEFGNRPWSIYENIYHQ